MLRARAKIFLLRADISASVPGAGDKTCRRFTYTGKGDGHTKHNRNKQGVEKKAEVTSAACGSGDFPPGEAIERWD